MKRSQRASDEVSADGVPQVSSFFRGACPTLLAFLLDLTWEDGEARLPGTLMLFRDGGQWKAWVNDKAQGRSAFVTATDLELLLERLEDGLGSDDLDWRKARPQAGGGRKRG